MSFREKEMTPDKNMRQLKKVKSTRNGHYVSKDTHFCLV